MTATSIAAIPTGSSAARPVTPILSRHQLVLDLSRPEVCDYLVESVARVLRRTGASYVKWDMNRHITDLGSAWLPAGRQRELSHRYMLGLYRVLDQLTGQFPEVLFEGCSSGGGRFDAGMLYYMPQTWASDNTDAVCRMQIQYGTSLLFPPVTMGSHVSAVPNHQTGRTTPLSTRFAVAMAGNLGYEMDIRTLSEEDRAELRQQIARYKALRQTLQQGSFYRLLDPLPGQRRGLELCVAGRQPGDRLPVPGIGGPAAPHHCGAFAGAGPGGGLPAAVGRGAVRRRRADVRRAERPSGAAGLHQPGDGAGPGGSLSLSGSDGGTPGGISACIPGICG